MSASTDKSGKELDDLFEYAVEATKKKLDLDKFCSNLQGFDKCLSQEDHLFLYGRYKQATVGPCNTRKPSCMDIEGYYSPSREEIRKWNTWKNLGNMSKEQAKNDYIQKLNAIDPDWLEKVKSWNKLFMMVIGHENRSKNNDWS